MSLKLIAGVDVGDRQGEKHESDRHHDDVKHEYAPGKLLQCVNEDKSRRAALT
jgi:hypothetical protein